jgi:hypothetical protein
LYETANNARHVHTFLMSALAALQQKDLPERKLIDPPRPLSWGFGASENGTALIKKGFSNPEHQLTWITGQDAEIELPSPGVNTELQLIIEARPFLGEGVPQRTVNVQANGIPVGTLGLADPEAQFYSREVGSENLSGRHSIMVGQTFTGVVGNNLKSDGAPHHLGKVLLPPLPFSLSD